MIYCIIKPPFLVSQSEGWFHDTQVITCGFSLLSEESHLRPPLATVLNSHYFWSQPDLLQLSCRLSCRAGSGSTKGNVKSTNIGRDAVLRSKSSSCRPSEVQTPVGKRRHLRVRDSQSLG